MKTLRSVLLNTSLFLGSLLVTLGVAEFVFRKLIFGSSEAFKNLRDPGYYSDYLNEDNYWKLYFLFGGESKPPENPHPLLGWVGNFDRNTLVHNETWKIGNKRPVLLYGDSYAQCMPGVKCFEDVLNNQPGFKESNYFINYGVGGYGVDQIQLLFDSTIHFYRDPFVVFSLMVYDIDRTPMSFRTGQKPIYTLIGDSLKLGGVPIDPDPEHFIKNNPPDISSYLYRRFLYSNLNVLSDNLNRKLKHWDEATQNKIALNSAVLKRVVKKLRDNNIDFVFLVFHYLKPGDDEFKVENNDNWRDVFLKEFLAENEIPYIWSKDLIKKDTSYTGSNYEKFMILENGHPTSYFNEIIAQEIRRKLLINENIKQNRIDSVVAQIQQSEEWFASIKRKAEKTDSPLAEVLRKDAQFLIDDMIAKHKVFPGTGYYENKITSDTSWYRIVSDKAIKNKKSLHEQLTEDARFIYNLEVEKSRKVLSGAMTYDSQMKHILDSLGKLELSFDRNKYMKNDSLSSPEMIIHKAAFEIYNQRNSTRSWY